MFVFYTKSCSHVWPKTLNSGYIRHSTYNNQAIPAVKIGDGLAYLIDLPFIDASVTRLMEHINNTQIHITQAEREFWNNKVRCDDDGLIQGGETLVFTIN